MRSKWSLAAVLFLFLLLGVVACRTPSLPTAGAEQAAAAPAATDLIDLKSMAQLQADFNEDSGRPRLLLILAPL